MKKLAPLLLLVFACFWRMQAQGELIEVQFVHNDSLRTYKLYIPAAYTGEEPWPLVIVLHGFTLNPDFMIALTGMNAVADTGHFLVAYPQGLLVNELAPPVPPFPETGTGWNSGGELISNNDDVGFLSKMIDKIGLSHKVDPARVYACGLSNGGFMVYRLACELSGRIAAVVSVSGGMPEASSCFPERPVPLMEIHGTADSIVPYIGIPPYVKSIPASIDFWVNNNQCNAVPVVIQLPDIVPGDGTTITLKKYGNCEADASVWLMDVIGAGHVWPTSYLPPPPFIGLPNDDVHGSSEIWNFFRQHVHPDPVLTQFPWHAPSTAFPNFPSGNPPGSILQFADMDGDDTTEAFVLVTGGMDVKYYENLGDDTDPQFQFVQSYPFGMPNVSGIAPLRYVDIDGDCDVDVFAAILPSVGNGMAFIENKGAPKAPWFGDSTPEIQPFGIVLPTSDSVPGTLPINNFFRFVDIDADNDLDLFLGGRFVKSGTVVYDENFYFYLNDDPSGNGTSPHFTGPIKNPFGLPRPLIPDGALAPTFVDIDCDSDWDFFAIYAGAAVSFFENTGTPTTPNFSQSPVTWMANNPPAPPGFEGYFFGDWLDVGGDGDKDLVLPGSWLENISDGTMACQASIPTYPQCMIIATDEPGLNADLSLYPNPAGDFLQLKLESEMPLGEINIEICNLLGQPVLHRKLEVQSGQLNITELQVGIYMLKASAGGRLLTRKFLKL